MTRRIPALLALLALSAAEAALAARVPVLRQIALPHAYYYREMFLPQLTSGPSSVAFAPDGQRVVYSMGGSLWLQALDSDTAEELTYGPGYDYQPDFSPDGKSIVYARHHADTIELSDVEAVARALPKVPVARDEELEADKAHQAIASNEPLWEPQAQDKLSQTIDEQLAALRAA